MYTLPLTQGLDVFLQFHEDSYWKMNLSQLIMYLDILLKKFHGQEMFTLAGEIFGNFPQPPKVTWTQRRFCLFQCLKFGPTQFFQCALLSSNVSSLIEAEKIQHESNHSPINNQYYYSYQIISCDKKEGICIFVSLLISLILSAEFP